LHKIKYFISFFLTDSNLTTKDKTVKGKGCTNDNHQRLSAGVEDKEMDNLRKWFSDKLALGLGNKDLMEKPKVKKKNEQIFKVEIKQGKNCFLGSPYFGLRWNC
jgi:hypothetical protein